MSDQYGNPQGFGQPPGGAPPPAGNVPPAGGQGMVAPQSSGPSVDPVAIVSLACGVVAMLSTCCCGMTVPIFGVPIVGLLALAGIITGIVALKRTNPRTGTRSGRGMAIGGLIVSTIGMLVLIIMVVLAFAVVGLDASHSDPDDLDAIDDIIEDIFD